MVRIKSRYLLVNVLYPELDSKASNLKVPDVVQYHQPTTDNITAHDLWKGIRAEVNNLFGDYGGGAVAGSISKSIVCYEGTVLKFVVKYWSPATSTFILRVSREHYRTAWAAMTLMNRVPVKGGRNCVFRVVRVSGTIKKSQEEVIRRAREMILKARRETEEQTGSTLDSIFGKGMGHNKEDSMHDMLEVDRSDSEDDEEMGDSDG
jgi:ribonuclease P/MRP protein subunit POP5